METTSTKINLGAQAAFVPIPDLDKMAVRNNDLYSTDESIDAVSAEVVSADIPLGIKGGITVINCEKGIKAFVKDVLAADKTNHLPNTETGVWIYYLTEGVVRDFNRTWMESPISIGKKETKTKIEKAKEQGKRGLSKKEKNELLAKRNYPYYEKDIASGAITMQQAFALMAEAAEIVKKYEDAGYFLSPKKTEGVALFDWKSSIIDAHDGNKDATKIYTRNKVNIIIPDLIDNYYAVSNHPKKLAKELAKTILALTAEVISVLYDDMETEGSIKTSNDLCNYLKENNKSSSSIAEIEKNYSIKGFHLTKIMHSGMSKPRQICIDCVSKKNSEHHLFLIDKEGVTLHFQ
jgi:hypothetical protein